jgi:hypothetical protein
MDCAYVFRLADPRFLKGPIYNLPDPGRTYRKKPLLPLDTLVVGIGQKLTGREEDIATSATLLPLPLILATQPSVFIAKVWLGRLDRYIKTYNLVFSLSLGQCSRSF